MSHVSRSPSQGSPGASAGSPAGVAARSDGLALMPWWCSPAGITFGFLIPTIGLITLAGQLDLPTLTIRGVSFLDAKALALGSLMLLPIALGGWVGAQVRLGRHDQVATDVRAWDLTAVVVGLIALFGYVFLFLPYLSNPMLLWQFITGAAKPTRTELGITAGPSSLVHLGQVFFAICAYRLTDGSGRPMRYTQRVLLAVLPLLTTARVYAYSERLAMMEMLVPFGLSLGRWMSERSGHRWAAVRNLGPYAALPLLILYFGIGEYFRSWSSATYQGKSSFWSFAIGRFVSYYYTALNNGAGVVETTPTATWHFEHVLEWAHRAPFGLGQKFSEYVGFNAEAKSSFTWFLRTYGDVEFNSNSGIFVPIGDLGFHGALVYMLLIGVVGGLAFRAFRGGKLLGVLFFPMVFMSFLEVFRYPYFGASRAFTWSLGIAFALICARLFSSSREANSKAVPRLVPSSRDNGSRHGSEGTERRSMRAARQRLEYR